MKRKPKTRYEEAHSIPGEHVLTIAQNELKALLTIIVQRTTNTSFAMNELEALWAIRDAARMLSGKMMDDVDAERTAEIERLTAELASNSLLRRKLSAQ